MNQNYIIKKIVTVLLFLLINSSITLQAQESDLNNEKSKIQTDEQSLEFMKAGQMVLTKEEIVLPSGKVLNHTFHNVTYVLNDNLFFKKQVYTGKGTNTIEVEYQVLYMSVPLLGFQPAQTAVTATPKKGTFTMNLPDQVMGAYTWVLGVIVNPSGVDYPSYVPRQSPWFKINDVKLFQKESRLSGIPVGTIISSVIPPDEFLDQGNEKYWVEADGRPIKNEWTYANLKSKPKRIPDLRGSFLRGRNYFSPLYGNRNDEFMDNGKRDPSGFQKDSIKQHTHRVPYKSWQQGHEGHGNIAAMTPYTQVFYNHANVPMGDTSNETRPKNFAVYYYIKIN